MIPFCLKQGIQLPIRIINKTNYRKLKYRNPKLILFFLRN